MESNNSKYDSTISLAKFIFGDGFIETEELTVAALIDIASAIKELTRFLENSHGL